MMFIRVLTIAMAILATESSEAALFDLCKLFWRKPTDIPNTDPVAKEEPVFDFMRSDVPLKDLEHPTVEITPATASQYRNYLFVPVEKIKAAGFRWVEMRHSAYSNSEVLSSSHFGCEALIDYFQHFSAYSGAQYFESVGLAQFRGMIVGENDHSLLIAIRIYRDSITVLSIPRVGVKRLFVRNLREDAASGASFVAQPPTAN